MQDYILVSSQALACPRRGSITPHLRPAGISGGATDTARIRQHLLGLLDFPSTLAPSARLSGRMRGTEPLVRPLRASHGDLCSSSGVSISGIPPVLFSHRTMKTSFQIHQTSSPTRITGTLLAGEGLGKPIASIRVLTRLSTLLHRIFFGGGRGGSLRAPDPRPAHPDLI
jgi:hypothetical protein